jgi:hypothetical protein
MQKADVIQLITPEVYAAECTAARRAAPFTGNQNAPYVYDPDIPFLISDVIWGGSNALTPTEQIHLVFDIYTDLPCYSLLCYVYMHHYRSLPSEAKEVYWTYLTTFLSQEDDALAQPIVYTLTVDFFENPDQCEEVWYRLVTDQANHWQIRRVLAAAIAVPFALKEPLYQKLLHDPTWHIPIYFSLLHSYYGYYGQIDKVKARQLLDSLTLPENIEHRAKFYAALASGERYANAFEDRY